MAITRKQKEAQVADLKEKFSKIKSAVITNYQGLDVENMQELRKKLRKENIDYKITKNNLTKLVIKDTNIEIDPKVFQGQIAIAYGYNDEIMPAKIIYEFSKEIKKPEILGGIFEGKYIDVSATLELAKIPGREELQGQLVSVLAGPMRGLANVLSGNMRELVSVLSQYHASVASKESKV